MLVIRTPNEILERRGRKGFAEDAEENPNEFSASSAKSLRPLRSKKGIRSASFQRPVNRGARFSMNARLPSSKSSHTFELRGDKFAHFEAEALFFGGVVQVHAGYSNSGKNL
jgi:hypothetical protein